MCRSSDHLPAWLLCHSHCETLVGTVHPPAMARWGKLWQGFDKDGTRCSLLYCPYIYNDFTWIYAALFVCRCVSWMSCSQLNWCCSRNQELVLTVTLWKLEQFWTKPAVAYHHVKSSWWRLQWYKIVDSCRKNWPLHTLAILRAGPRGQLGTRNWQLGSLNCSTFRNMHFFRSNRYLTD